MGAYVGGLFVFGLNFTNMSRLRQHSLAVEQRCVHHEEGQERRKD